MYENLNRELKILSIFSAILLIGAVVYLVWVLSPTHSPKISPTPSPKISPLNKPLLDFPSAQSIQSVSLIEGGCANRGLLPKNPSAVADKTLRWLNDAKPLSVDLPKLHENVPSACGLLYSSLYFQTKNGDHFDLFPANYIQRGGLY